MPLWKLLMSRCSDPPESRSHAILPSSLPGYRLCSITLLHAAQSFNNASKTCFYSLGIFKLQGVGLRCLCRLRQLLHKVFRKELGVIITKSLCEALLYCFGIFFFLSFFFSRCFKVQKVHTFSEKL